MKLEELGRRAVACKRWRWLPGMLALTADCKEGVRVHSGGGDYLIGWRDGATVDGGGIVELSDDDIAWPDLTDPATIGCLWALVRRAYKWAMLVHWYSFDGEGPLTWAVEVKGARHCGWSEKEALVVALEAAP